MTFGSVPPGRTALTPEESGIGTDCCCVHKDY